MALRTPEQRPTRAEAAMLPPVVEESPSLNIIDHNCRRRSILEARIAEQAKVVQAARLVVATVFASGTALTDAEADAFTGLIDALHGLPPVADA